jgi:hypothetical protein
MESGEPEMAEPVARDRKFLAETKDHFEFGTPCRMR